MKRFHKILVGIIGVFIIIGFIFGIIGFIRGLQESGARSDIPVDTTEHIASKQNLIVVYNPKPLVVVTSPLTVRGEARGPWYFEASFPVVLVDWDGRIIAESYASAQDDPEDGSADGASWMTEDFVPFEGTVEFEMPEDIGDFSKRGALIFRKDNPSGLPEYDDALEIPVLFAPLGTNY